MNIEEFIVWLHRFPKETLVMVLAEGIDVGFDGVDEYVSSYITKEPFSEKTYIYNEAEKTLLLGEKF